uniref:EF-hand domain-containing protein n=1 Tax=Aegilops tauschii TaxID=37682 RepID=R7W3Y9_AEGTA
MCGEEEQQQQRRKETATSEKPLLGRRHGCWLELCKWQDLRHAFRVFDADGNGVISPAELARVLRGLGEAATVAQCRRMIEGVDRNGDGLVSFDEFKLMMANGKGFGLAQANVRA